MRCGELQNRQAVHLVWAVELSTRAPPIRDNGTSYRATVVHGRAPSPDMALRDTQGRVQLPAPVPALENQEHCFGMGKPPCGHLSQAYRILLGVPFKGRDSLRCVRTNPLTGMVQRVIGYLNPRVGGGLACSNVHLP